MITKDYLEKDDSYLSKQIKNCVSSNRQAYEDGFHVGWRAATYELGGTMKHPHTVNLTDEEYQDFMIVLQSFGYTFEYIRQLDPDIGFVPTNYHPGLNMVKNIDSPNVIPDELKSKIINLIKEYYETKRI